MSKITRKVIAESFMELLQQKSLDKITVKDIIELANVNRNTFYYHYKDILDLLETMFRQALHQFQSDACQEETFSQAYYRLMDFLISNRQSIDHIYHSRCSDLLQQYIESCVQAIVYKYVDRKAEGKNLDQKSIEYITHFYTHAIIGVTIHWIRNHLRDPMSQLVRIVAISFESTVDDMIRTFTEVSLTD